MNPLVRNMNPHTNGPNNRTSEIIIKRNELYSPSIYKKAVGTLVLKNRTLEWKPALEHKHVLPVLINFDQIIGHERTENTEKQTALLRVKTRENRDGIIFSFNGGILFIFKRCLLNNYL
jgi:hypothetical protein